MRNLNILPSCDRPFHEAYISDVNYTPTLTAVHCRNCGTRLKVYYCEERLFAVKCGYCETVTLVKAGNPTQAMRFVGEYEEKQADENNEG